MGKANVSFNYESPLVTVVEIQVESGFAVTNPTGTIDPWG